MAQEIFPRGCTGDQGEQLSLTTTVTALGVPPGRDGHAVRGVILYSTGAFRFHLNPRIRSCLRTQDDGSTFTDATENASDRDTSTVLTLNSQDTEANGDLLYVGSDHPFGGIVVDMGNANGNASAMVVDYWNGTAWTSIHVQDGTATGGPPADTTLGQDGNLTWALPTDWEKTSVDGKSLYWVKIDFDAALDSAVSVREMALLNKDSNRSYAYGATPVTIPLSPEVGAIEALVASGTGTLDLNWLFGNVAGM